MYRYNVITKDGEYVCLSERNKSDLIEDLSCSEWFCFVLENGHSLLVKTSRIKIILLKNNGKV